MPAAPVTRGPPRWPRPRRPPTRPSSSSSRSWRPGRPPTGHARRRIEPGRRIDRANAARERARLEAELRSAHLDDLTGAYRRDMGRLALSHEIDRARRSDGRFVVAFVDVDGLKDVNDREGHAAGDHVLETVVDAIRMRLRSFDPIIRYGGDEFVCGLIGTDIQEAERRFESIGAAIEQQAHVGISVGLAELDAGRHGRSADRARRRRDARRQGRAPLALAGSPGPAAWRSFLETGRTALCVFTRPPHPQEREEHDLMTTQVHREPVWSDVLTAPLARRIPAGRRPATLAAIKVAHTAIFFSVLAMIVLLTWTACAAGRDDALPSPWASPSPRPRSTPATTRSVRCPRSPNRLGRRAARSRTSSCPSR